MYKKSSQRNAFWDDLIIFSGLQRKLFKKVNVTGGWDHRDWPAEQVTTKETRNLLYHLHVGATKLTLPTNRPCGCYIQLC